MVWRKCKQIYEKFENRNSSIVFGYIWVLIRHDNRNERRGKKQPLSLTFTAAVKLFISDYLQCVPSRLFVCFFLSIFLEGVFLWPFGLPRIVANIHFFYGIWLVLSLVPHISQDVNIFCWFDTFNLIRTVVDLGYSEFLDYGAELLSVISHG